LKREWLKRTVLTAVIVISCVGTASVPAQEHPADGSENLSFELGEVVVTAERIQEYIESHPQQVTMMTRDQIARGSYTDLNQVLDAMPGVDVKKSGSGLGSRISIRGSGNSGKIVVLINGRPANSTQYGSVDLDSIPLDMVKRVDVFKPPVPVWIGPGGTAGAVNILLANPPAGSDKKQKTTRIGVQGGSFGKVGANASRLMLLDGHQVRITAAGNHRDGRRTNSDSDNGSVSFQWDLPSRETVEYDLNGRYYQSGHGSPGRTDNPTPNARQSYRKGALDLGIKGLWGETCDYELKTYLDVTRLEDESDTGLTSNLDALTCGIKNETNWSGDNDRWAVRLSGNLARDSIDHTLSGDHHRDHASFGLQGDRVFGGITASLGTRCDYTSDFDFQPAVTGGVSIPIGARTRAKINAGYGTNVPTFGQLYQPSHGSIDQVRGNPDLKEEHVWNLSTGVSWCVTKDNTVEVTAFREDTDDLIVYREGADQIHRPVNIDGAYRQGIEAVAGWKLNASANIEVSCLLQESRNRENDKNLTYTPDQKIKATLNWTFPTQTRSITTVSFVSRQFSDLENTSEKQVDGYTCIDLKLIQPVHFQRWQCECFVSIMNLLDEAYEVHHGYPDDGFRVTAGINFNF